MKVKMVEITKEGAYKKLDKVIGGATITILLCVLMLSLSQAFPVAIPVINMMLGCVGVFGIMVGLAILLVISFSKSKIRALNILFYGTKFTLKEVKKDE
jgi:hypothetical protein